MENSSIIIPFYYMSPYGISIVSSKTPWNFRNLSYNTPQPNNPQQGNKTFSFPLEKPNLVTFDMCLKRDKNIFL